MVKKVFAYVYIYLILLLMYIPVLVLIAFSFTNSTYIGEWNGFSFNLYGALFKDKEIMVALGNTIIIAIISSVVSTLLGTFGAIGAFYSKKRSRALLENLNQIPVVNAEIVIALSLTVMFVFLGNVIFKNNIFSFWTLLIGHIVISAPFVYLNVKPKLSQLDPNLYEAALDLGCSPNQALRKIMLPQIYPGILSGFLLAITLSLDDFIVTAFTRGAGLLSGEANIETLSTLIQAKIKKGPIPMNMRPLTTLIFIVVLVAAILVTIYQNRNKNKSKTRKGRD
ncbi:MAG TPA: putrescine aminotransferase [Firmicutes bacterium]|nr:putrescine aminotransferase [Bacillota bacterium]